MNPEKRNGNGYTLLYAGVLMVVVAAILAFAAQALKPRQESNVATEQRLYILRSIHLAPDAYTVKDRNAYVAAEYDRYIVQTQTDDGLPVYVGTLDNGQKKYIFPVSGTGLWGAIWGYIALDSDFDTLYGALFDHKSETPGLGAEIASTWFSQQFDGKSLFEEGAFVSIQVVKGGRTEGLPHAVDAVSGGTITSRAVETMIREGLTRYLPYIQQQTNRK